MRLAPIRPIHIKNIATCIASFMTHGEISELFEYLSYNDPTQPARSKVDRIYETLIAQQHYSQSSGPVAKFIEEAATPARFIDSAHSFRSIRSQLNHKMAFIGWSLTARGKLITTEPVETLEEAAALANRVIAELNSRSVHPEVLKYCEQELLVDDIFHGLHEATKGVSERLRRMSGLSSDGATLFQECFGGKSGKPKIRINQYQTQSDESEQKGFLNLLIGMQGLWRNPTAHEARINSCLQEMEVVNALTTISYIHDRLDHAVMDAVPYALVSEWKGL